MLSTHFQVGAGVGIKVITDIYSQIPTPKAEYWINIFSDPKESNASDEIANLGEQWVPSARQTDIFHISKNNHEAAGEMFKENLPNDQSCESMLRFMLSTYLGKE